MRKKGVHGLDFSSDSELGRASRSDNKKQPELHRVQVDPTDFASAAKRLAVDAANFVLIGGFQNQGSDRFLVGSSEPLIHEGGPAPLQNGWFKPCRTCDVGRQNDEFGS